MVLGIDKGDPTCTFMFPEEDPTEPMDAYRIFIYANDYSLHLHGNPRLDVKLPPDAWAFRITPYGTTHTATWAKIISSLPTLQQQANLLESIAEIGGSRMLGTKSSRFSTHPEIQRPGRAPPPELNIPEGHLATLTDLKTMEVLVEEGVVLEGAKGLWYVGNIRFEVGKHSAREVVLTRKRRCT